MIRFTLRRTLVQEITILIFSLVLMHGALLTLAEIHAAQ